MATTMTCLWFDQQAEEAVNFYISLFPNSRILDTKYYLEGQHGPVGSVLTILFSLDGTEYLALNGGPHYHFTPAVSIVAYCDTQQQVDTLWEKLSAGGEESHCGWLVDRFGLSWQVVPRVLLELINHPDTQAAQRAYAAMLTMRKLDIAKMQQAFAQAPSQ